jgi:hypothetical protein
VAQMAELFGDSAPQQPADDVLALVKFHDSIQAAQDTWHAVAAGGTAVAIGVGDPTLEDRVAALVETYGADAHFLWAVWSVGAIDRIALGDEERAEGDEQFEDSMDTCRAILEATARHLRPAECWARTHETSLPGRTRHPMSSRMAHTSVHRAGRIQQGAAVRRAITCRRLGAGESVARRCFGTCGRTCQ